MKNFLHNSQKLVKKGSDPLLALKKQNLYRSLTDIDRINATEIIIKEKKQKLISFASNDYFGLSFDKKVKKAAIDAINKYGVASGSSRYISGNNSLYAQLEKQIAKIKNCDDAIVFSSGYQAAIGAVSALVGDGDLVVADKLIHACLIDAVKLSGAKLMRFKRNDIKHARQVILGNTKKYQKILIITEDVFSMDGDKGNVEALLKLAQEFNCQILSDGAHSLFDEKFGKNKNFIRMGTLSKAVGSFGGYIAANKKTIEYLRNFSRAQIYTTALPPSVLAASTQALKIISQQNLAKKTLENANYFCKLMNLEKPQSAIVVIKIGDNKKVIEIRDNLIKQGFLISAIRPPTVEPNGARLRITFSTLHKKEQIKELAQLLTKFI